MPSSNPRASDNGVGLGQTDFRSQARPTSRANLRRKKKEEKKHEKKQLVNLKGMTAEKRKIYKFNTRAADATIETAKALQDSIDDLITIESDRRREREEYQRYGSVSIVPDKGEQAQFTSQVRREVARTEARTRAGGPVGPSKFAT